jgi:hypothetical protein
MAKFMDVSVKVNFANLRGRNLRQRIALRRLPNEFLDVVKKNTPIDSGNARRNTFLRNNRTVRSNYAYAKRLNEGWSRQAPSGFVKPSLLWLRNRIQQIFRLR